MEMKLIKFKYVDLSCGAICDGEGNLKSCNCLVVMDSVDIAEKVIVER